VSAVDITGDGHYINPEGLTWYLKLNWILYMASSTPAILISLLFWALLYNPGTLSASVTAPEVRSVIV